MNLFAKPTKLAALALVGLTILSTVPASAGWRGHGHGGNGPGWGGPGWNGPGWGGPGRGGPRYNYGPRRNDNGAAIAAGIIGGLALGAIVASSANRPRCWMETQTFYNRWGEPRYRDVEVCR